MIFCVVPEVLAEELFDKLVKYYEDDDNVQVIVNRRSSERRSKGQQSAAEQRQVRDRRRARVPGEFPELGGGGVGDGGAARHA